MTSYDYMYTRPQRPPQTIHRSKTPGPDFARQHRHFVDPEPVERPQTPQPTNRRVDETLNSHPHMQSSAYAYTRARTHTLPSRHQPENVYNNSWTNNQSSSRDWHQRAAAVEEVDFDDQVKRMKEEARRNAAMREVERTRALHEEVKRVQARIRQRRDHEWQHVMRKLQEEEEERERERHEAVKAAFSNIWNMYEKRWASLANSAQPLTFAMIPWPTLNRPSSPSSLNIKSISAFLLSPYHSVNVPAKDRIKQALKRWHPDRFGRILAKAKAEDKAIIEEGAGIVARCLNEILHAVTKQSVN